MATHHVPATVGLALLVGVSALADPRGESPPGNGGELEPRVECIRCHASETRIGHPVGVAAPRSTDLPLGPQGTIVCQTCHEGLESQLRHGLERLGGELRRLPDRLCRSCHALPSDPSSALAHAMILGRAHLPPRTEPRSDPFGLDAETRSCLSCHDGLAAPSAGVREIQAAPRARGGAEWRSTPHPIGVDYERASFRSGLPQLRPSAGLPESVLLYDGKLGCGSCHSIYSNEADMLVVDGRRGRLCLTCHIK